MSGGLEGEGAAVMMDKMAVMMVAVGVVVGGGGQEGGTVQPQVGALTLVKCSAKAVAPQSEVVLLLVPVWWVSAAERLHRKNPQTVAVLAVVGRAANAVAVGEKGGGQDLHREWVMCAHTGCARPAAWAPAARSTA